MKKYDIVIIGSGFGGLICGYILSKNGYKVGVFEKQFQIGGCLQTFERKGITFDTGMHYVGSMEPGQLLHRIFTFLGLLDDVKVHKLDTDGFEHILLNGKEYRFAMGYENFVDTLAESFPDDRKTLVQYVSDLQKFTTSSPILSPEKLVNNDFFTRETVKTGIGTYLDSLTSNTELQNVLSGTNMLYAGKRNKTPLYIHALINSFYIHSAWRIAGGASSIANSLSNSIRRFGGEVFTNADVKSIICDSSRATSMKLADGEIIEAKYFISNTHPEVTLNMLETPLIKRIYRERITNVENTVSNFTLYIEFKPDTVPYANYNFYKYNVGNVWDCGTYTQKDWPRHYIFMHQVPQKNAGFAESGVMIAYMQFSEVDKWSNTYLKNRGGKNTCNLKRLKRRFYCSSLKMIFREYEITLKMFTLHLL
jgi:all-trans-retinol 13,14-reductase